MKTVNVKQSEAVAMRSPASRCELVLHPSSSGLVVVAFQLLVALAGLLLFNPAKTLVCIV